jgi:hypothetical protein
MVNGQPTVLAQDWAPFELGQSYDLRVSVAGDHIQVFLDNKRIFDVHDGSFSHGQIALYCWGNVNTHFGNVRVSGL